MQELVASIASKGVLQPILVRPNGGKDSFLIVAGHRRHKASCDAGMTKIPAIIRTLSDADALELQIIENSQREDPNPMEEAWGFDRLIKIGKHTADTLASKLDKSVDYVLGRISLLKIPDEAQKKVAAGEISLGHALLITRLRHASEQKEFLKMLQRDNGITVKEAQRQISGFSKDIKDALFDASACKVCDFLGRNQTNLFPELKNSGECMDRGCFFAKERDHIKAVLDKKKGEGFKIMLDKKEVIKLTASYGGGKGEKIKGDLSMKGHYYADVPKRYKSDCAKCTDNHVFFMYEEKDWRGKALEFGELCLNKSCLRKMNNPSRGSAAGSAEGNGRVSASTARAHATACRDRFLKANLPAKISVSEALQRRILIYTLLIKYDRLENRGNLLKALDPKFNDTGYCRDTAIYEAVMEAKPEVLGQMLERILVASIEQTDADVLLRMTPEAGIDMLKDFPPDKTYLSSKTKAELEAIMTKFKLPTELKMATAKKGDIIAEILKHDLCGKLTKDLTDTVTLKPSGKAKAIEEERSCRVCGCTDEEALDDGCSWIEGDLCSACADKAKG
jgi:ParB/RepB/Spo0J family partition protein